MKKIIREHENEACNNRRCFENECTCNNDRTKTQLPHNITME